MGKTSTPTFSADSFCSITFSTTPFISGLGKVFDWGGVEPNGANVASDKIVYVLFFSVEGLGMRHGHLCYVGATGGKISECWIDPIERSERND